MKILEIFDDVGNLLGEVHSVDTDSGFGCFLTIALPIIAIFAVGISVKTVWEGWIGMVFAEGKSLQDTIVNFIYYMLIPVLTTVVTTIVLLKDETVGFWDSWFGVTLMGTLIPSVIAWLSMWIARVEDFSFWLIFACMWFYFSLTVVIGLASAIFVCMVKIGRKIHQKERSAKSRGVEN